MEGAIPQLPATNGYVQHSLQVTPAGELKKVRELRLDAGQAEVPITPTIAGEIRLGATLMIPKAEAKHAAKTSAKVQALALTGGETSAVVKAGAAVMFDLVALEQTAASGMRVMVHARDAYGNLDEECDREVHVELGQPLVSSVGAVELPGDGIVKLRRGIAEIRGIRPKPESGEGLESCQPQP